MTEAEVIEDIDVKIIEQGCCCYDDDLDGGCSWNLCRC